MCLVMTNDVTFQLAAVLNPLANSYYEPNTIKDCKCCTGMRTYYNPHLQVCLRNKTPDI